MKILEILTPKKKIGNFGEKEAVRFLRKKGYKILEKNYTALGAEIDIIARLDNLTTFVEVKTRNIKHIGYKEPRPASSVTPEKQRKIIKAAGHYIAHHNSATRLRLDVIEVYTEGDMGKRLRVVKINHIEGAFDKNTAFDRGYAYQRKKEGSNL